MVLLQAVWKRPTIKSIAYYAQLMQLPLVVIVLTIELAQAVSLNHGQKGLILNNLEYPSGTDWNREKRSTTVRTNLEVYTLIIIAVWMNGRLKVAWEQVLVLYPNYSRSFERSVNNLLLERPANNVMKLCQ